MVMLTVTEKKETSTVTTTYDIQDNELWSNFWGCGLESDPVTRNYLMSLDFFEGDWNTAGVAQVGYVDPDDDSEGEDESKWLTKRLNVQDLANALTMAMQEGYRHVPCGGKIDADFDNWDACVGDIILQLALYGEETYA